MELHDYNVVTTGGASGLGLAAAKRFFAAGAPVVISDLREEAAVSAARAIDEQGDRVIGLRCEVGNPDDPAVLVEQAEAFFGAPIDVFIANCKVRLPVGHPNQRL